MKAIPVQSCQHFPECGGCEHLHITYPNQLKKKQELIGELFRDFPDLSIGQIIPSPQNQFYRHKVQLPFATRKIGHKSVLTIGLHNRDKKFVIDQKECRIQDKDLTTVVSAIRHWARIENLTAYDERNPSGFLRHVVLRKSGSTPEILVCIVTNYGDFRGKNKVISTLPGYINQFLSKEKSVSKVVGILENINDQKTKTVLGHVEKTWSGRNLLNDRIGTFEFQIGISNFFQVNPFQIENLYTLILNEIRQGAIVVDAYCGIGTISIFVSGKAGKVTGLEENTGSVNLARENAKRNKVENTDFIAGNVLSSIKNAMNEDAEVLVVDPPREGLDPGTINLVLQSKIKKILYVSCNPETLLRDSIHISRKFHFDALTPVDMFPHTSHIESFSVFTR